MKKLLIISGGFVAILATWFDWDPIWFMTYGSVLMAFLVGKIVDAAFVAADAEKKAEMKRRIQADYEFLRRQPPHSCLEEI